MITQKFIPAAGLSTTKKTNLSHISRDYVQPVLAVAKTQKTFEFFTLIQHQIMGAVIKKIFYYQCK